MLFRIEVGSPTEHEPSQPVGRKGSECLSLRVQFPEQQRGAHSLPLPPPCFGSCRERGVRKYGRGRAQRQSKAVGIDRQAENAIRCGSE